MQPSLSIKKKTRKLYVSPKLDSHNKKIFAPNKKETFINKIVLFKTRYLKLKKRGKRGKLTSTNKETVNRNLFAQIYSIN